MSGDARQERYTQIVACGLEETWQVGLNIILGSNTKCRSCELRSKSVHLPEVTDTGNRKGKPQREGTNHMETLWIM